MTAIPDFIDALRRQQRAARHTVSLLLLVNAVAITLLAVLNSRPQWRHQLWTVLLPGAVYLLLWLVVRLRRPLTGMGNGPDAFGLIAVIALGAVVALPFTLPVVFLLGACLLGLASLAYLRELAELREPRLP